MTARYLLTLTLLFLLACNASAVTYRWEDSTGVHLTDDPGTVPAELRKRPVTEDENGVVVLGRLPPMDNVTSAMRKRLEETERINQARDRIVMEAIRQHQAEVIKEMSRQAPSLQRYAIKVFSENRTLWMLPGLLLLAIWLVCLADIMRSRFVPTYARHLWLAIVLLLPVVAVPLYYIFARNHKVDDESVAESEKS